MAMAVATTSAASLMAISSMRSALGEHLGDLDGRGHLDVLGSLDGLLGLELRAQLLVTDEHERIRGDHGLHQGTAAGGTMASGDRPPSGAR